MSITASEDILIVYDLLDIQSTIASTNNTTGAMVVSGGVGIGGDKHIGNDIVVEGNTTFEDTLTIGTGTSSYDFPTQDGLEGQVLVYTTSGSLIFVSPETPSSVGIQFAPDANKLLKSFGTGKDVETSNVAVSDNDDMTGVSTISILSDSTINGSLVLTSTVSSTNTTTGSMIVGGGMGVGENINIGGDLNVSGESNLVNTLTIGTGPTSYTLPTERGVTGQLLFMSTTGGLIMETSGETIDDVIAAPDPFGSDNRLVRSDGAGGREIEATDIILSDFGDLTGINDIGIDSPALIGGALSLTGVTSSTDTVTGAMIVSGGVGVAENVNVGGDTNISGVVNINNTTVSSDTTSGALIVSGGVGIDGDLNVNGTINAGDLDLGNTNITINSTTASTNATSGALVVFGGSGIQGDANIAGDINISGALNATTVIITDTTSSTTNGTGALIIAGGIGLAENLNMGGIMNVNNTTGSTAPNNGAMVVDGGLGVQENVNIGNDVAVTGAFNVDSTANSTGTGTGALVVSGGMSVTKDLYIGDSLFVNNPVVATSKFFNAYHTSVVSAASATFVAIPWDVELRKDSGQYTHGAGSADIDVVESGWYEITAEISTQIEAGDGTRNTIGSARITINGSPIGETITYAYNRTAQRGHYTTNITVIQNLNANDTINIEMNQALGTATITTVAEANRLFISRI